MEWQKDEFIITTDNSKMDIALIQDFLSKTYWAEKIPVSVVERSVAGALCFGIFHNERQVGFARVITDKATFGYLADVFVIESYRGKGLSKWLMGVIINHPDLQGFRRFLLATRDAHGLYRQFGFTELPSTASWMQIHRPDVYKSAVSH